ncbi:hypothetical protein P3T21_007771 [Paraburkholderia sp. GAS334]
MIDDQVNAEELAESKNQREAAETATDDCMPVVPESKARDVEVIQYRTPKQWVKHSRKWAGARGSPMQSRWSVMVGRKPDLP